MKLIKKKGGGKRGGREELIVKVGFGGHCDVCGLICILGTEWVSM